MESLLTQIDDIKEKITDQEYIDLMKSLNLVNNKEKKKYYKFTVAKIKEGNIFIPDQKGPPSTFLGIEFDTFIVDKPFMGNDDDIEGIEGSEFCEKNKNKLLNDCLVRRSGCIYDECDDLYYTPSQLEKLRLELDDEAKTVMIEIERLLYIEILD